MTITMRYLGLALLLITLIGCGGESTRPTSTKRTATTTSTPNHPGLKLLAKAPCKTCHNRKVKAIGPSYLAIADRYDATDATVAMLASKVKNGGKGNWGEAVMNPHPQLADADIEQMIRYILSMEP